jgi:hypothetical protein
MRKQIPNQFFDLVYRGFQKIIDLFAVFWYNVYEVKVMYNSPSKMIRKQIYLKPSQQKQLNNFARIRNLSEAEIIRLAIDSYLERNQLQENNPLQQLVGLCKEPAPTDLAENHDQYLADKNNVKRT